MEKLEMLYEGKAKKVFKTAQEDVYIVDSWYKPGVPQLIHSDLVQEYIPNN